MAEERLDEVSCGFPISSIIVERVQYVIFSVLLVLFPCSSGVVACSMRLLLVWKLTSQPHERGWMKISCGFPISSIIIERVQFAMFSVVLVVSLARLGLLRASMRLLLVWELAAGQPHEARPYFQPHPSSQNACNLQFSSWSLSISSWVRRVARNPPGLGGY